MYLVAGANGFLGSYIIKNILERTNERVLATCRDLSRVWTSDERVRWLACDLSEPLQVDALVDEAEGCDEAVRAFFLAATHHPDVVERDPEAARWVNIEMLSRFIKRAGSIQALFYPSTDSVYGNSEGGYHFAETDALAPVNTYGRQKAEAEQVVLNAGYNVLRFPFLAGRSLLPHKKHFCDVIIETITSGKPMELFCDSYRSSLDFNTAARLAVGLSLMDGDSVPPVLNLSGDEDLSKYDVGLRLAERYGADKRCVVPIKMSEDSTIFVTKRAQSTLLDNTLAKRALGLEQILMEL